MLGAAATASFTALSSKERVEGSPHEPEAAPVPAAAPSAANRNLAPATFQSTAGAIVAASSISLVATFAMHLVNLRMQEIDIDAPAISLSVALQALAICVTALLSKELVSKHGLRQLLAPAAVLCAVSLLLTFLVHDLKSIALLRVSFAIGLTLLVIASEYLVTSRCDDMNRASLVGSYATCVGVCTVIGPFLVGLFGVSHIAPYLFGGTLLLLGAAGLHAFLGEKEGVTDRTVPPIATVRFMPAVFLGAFVFGAVDNGGLSLLPVYGAENDYSTYSAANLAVFAAIGATMLQMPIAWAAVRHTTTATLLALAVCAIVVLSAFPFVISQALGAYCVAFVFGGLCEGLFTVALIGLSRDRRVQSLSALNACFIAVISLGEVAGPLATSLSMSQFGPDGLIYALVALFSVYVLTIAVSARRNVAAA